jgi:hypothetical protein
LRLLGATTFDCNCAEVIPVLGSTGHVVATRLEHDASVVQSSVQPPSGHGILKRRAHVRVFQARGHHQSNGRRGFQASFQNASIVLPEAIPSQVCASLPLTTLLERIELNAMHLDVVPVPNIPSFRGTP